MRIYPGSHYDYASLLKRLFTHRVIDPVTGCWLWPHRVTNGYGSISFVHHGKRYQVRVHRLVAWMYLGYDGTRGVEICHRCNVKACFNPAHLYIATHKQNLRDAQADGLVTQLRGEKHCHAKLTEDQVREAVAMVQRGLTHREVAEHFGVTKSAITLIVMGKNWKHLGVATTH